MASSTEIIHLEVAGDRRGTEKYKFRTNFKPKKQYKKLPYFADPKIVPRVKQYLEDNKDKMYVDIDEMVNELQQKYRDYSKKKRIPFKSIVEKAFSVVLDLYRTRDQNSQDQEGSDSSDISDMEIDSEDDLDLIEDHDQANSQVVGMYMQQHVKKMAAAKASMSSNDKELIDLSSDEEEGEVQVSPKSAKLSDSNQCPDHQKPSAPTNKETTNSHATSNHAVNNTTQLHPSHVESNSSVRNVIVPTTPTIGKQLPIQTNTEKSSRKRKAAELNGQNTPKNGEAPRRKRRDFTVQTPCSSFKDVGGCSNVLQEVCKLLIHIRHPEIFEQIGVSPPRGFLLHGPPGCGKTLLANSIAGELGVPLLKVAAPELVAGVSGESEERIRDLFEQAASIAPCVLFLDEVDAITPNRNNAQREMERRIVAQLLTSLDELGDKEGGNQVLVLGATNRPDALDPALRRAGRFDREVCMGIPDRTARAHILRVVCGRLALAPDVSSDSGMDNLAGLTPGFVGADLTALTREAAMVAVNRVFSEIKEERKNEENLKAQNSQAELDVSKERDEKNDEQKAEERVSHELEKKEGEEKTVEQKTDNIQVVDVHIEAPSTNLETKKSEGEQKVQEGESNGKSNSQIEAAGEKTGEGEPIGKEDKVEETLPQKIDAKIGTVSGEEEVQIPKENGNKEENAIALESKSELKDQSPEEKSEDSVSKDEVLAVQEEIEIIVQENRGEKRKEEGKDSLPNKKSKSDDEVEVLEVDMESNTKSEDRQVANLETSSQKTDDNSVMLVEEALNGVSKDGEQGTGMSLSKQLGSFSGWTPELCEMVSWLQETPPLSTAQLSKLHVTMADFHEALRHVQPSAKREGFATVPDVTWDDVGSLSDVRCELQIAILAPVRYPDQFQKLGLSAPTGVLLCGPPGCGKTLLAKAIANEAGINFISVKGPELLNMYVGESERAVRQVFQRARSSAPCVIFFDEVDALCPKRSDSGDSGVSSRVVNQLLTEMDGVEGRSAVFIMAATNRPDIIDPAVMRPGRLDKILYVGLPTAADRVDILRALTKNGTKPTLAPDVNLAELAQMPVCDGYTGADLASLVREAGVHSLRECISSDVDLKSASLAVSKRHFISAMAKIRPSVTEKDKKHYEKLKQMYTAAPQSPVQAMDVS